MCTLSTGASCTAPVTIGANFDHDVDGAVQRARGRLGYSLLILCWRLCRPTPGFYIGGHI
ncbi:hypothetical protein BZG13_13120 [Salinivibrio sp. ML323]|nr:hypothetical protein BZG13_13120 [Salinivibrio sp. ML323]